MIHLKQYNATQLTAAPPAAARGHCHTVKPSHNTEDQLTTELDPKCLTQARNI